MMTRPKIIFFTGASGAGKTTLVHALSQALPNASAAFLHFDNIGIPTEAEMIKVYGSGTEWQKRMTFNWAQKLVEQSSNEKLIVFEGQTDLQFIVEAFAAINFAQYQIILVHCDAITRHQRLEANREQPELINTDMDNWAGYLYKQAVAMGVPILNTTQMNVSEIINWFKKTYYTPKV